MFSAASKTGSKAAPAANYIEDVFSTYLYNGTSSAKSINNEIDLSTKGGMTWIKCRTNLYNHYLFDTSRGALNYLSSNTTEPSSFYSGTLTSFNNNGFSIGTNSAINSNFNTWVSWTFRKQPKFFDVVTYTGTGSAQNIAHNLGSVPGMIIVKRTDTTDNWAVYHRSLANTQYLVLNSTAAAATGATWWNSTTPTSSVFSLGTDASVNASGGTYVAYIYAHNAGGFGTTGTDNVISCGSFTTDGSGNAIVNLGYEPQYVMVKNTTSAQNWYVEDSMRAFNLAYREILFPNLEDAETTEISAYLSPNATGFAAVNNQLSASSTYIYMAIRRPMKVPTDATTVFKSNTSSAFVGTPITTGFPVDLQILGFRDFALNKWAVDRLRGISSYASSIGQTLYTNLRSAETTDNFSRLWGNTGFTITASYSGNNMAFWNFRRATGFFDIVCYTGTGGRLTSNHNLGVAPELIITKSRTNTSFAASNAWLVYCSYLTGTVTDQYLSLNTTAAKATNRFAWGDITDIPNATTFTTGGIPCMDNNVGAVAYLFASLAGVSKVGSYTGTGATQTINCGFTGGARFVLIKRTDSTGNWYVWDTARGMVSETDPKLALNSTDAETNENWVYTATTGFQIVTTDASVNASGGSYIFLAIA